MPKQNVNRHVAILAAIISFAVITTLINMKSKPIGGQSIDDARLVTEQELEVASKSLPFFLDLGADDTFNYYQLRELGYFKTKREFAKNNHPTIAQIVPGMAPVGSAGTFVTMNRGRLGIPSSEVLTESNLASFTPYLQEPNPSQ